MEDHALPRLQDLSRPQAFGHSARMLLRAAPLLVPNRQSPSGDVEAYFRDLIEFAYLLFDVVLGNTTPEEAVPAAKEFDCKLAQPAIFEEKSQRLVYAVRLITDDLGAMGTVRYFERPGTPQRDKANASAIMFLAESGEVLSRFGMLPSTLYEPAALDLQYIIDHREVTGPLVTPAFLERRLWPDDTVCSFGKQGMLPGYQCLTEEWFERLEQLELSGLRASYAGLLSGVSVMQKAPLVMRGGTHVVNNSVTITLGDGSSFTGPVTLAQTIQDSFIAAGDSERPLDVKLRETVQHVSRLVEALDEPADKSEVTANLESFVNEARQPEPSKPKLQLAAQNILNKAVTVAKFITPIAGSVEAVLKLAAGT